MIAGVEKPATLTSPIGIPGGTTGGDRHVDRGHPQQQHRHDHHDPARRARRRSPQFALKGTAKLDFGRIYTALLEVFYSYDGNTTRYQRVGCTSGQACPDAPFEYVFGNFNQLGVNATLQARF